MNLYVDYICWLWGVRAEMSNFCGWSESWRRPTGQMFSRFQFSKERKIRETCLAILWPSWQFYSGGVWKSHRKEVQKTEHNPKKTQQNAISGDNKGGKGDGVGLRGDSIEMLSVPDSQLTELRREKLEEKKGGRDKWGRGGDHGASKRAKRNPCPVEKQGIEKMSNERKRRVKFSK